MKKTVVAIFFGLGTFAQAQLQLPVSDYEKIEAQVIEWRHDIHQNPELSNQEFKTAAKIAAHLKSLGIEVTTGVAKTGVVG
ncbi:MAG: amidohydrolase, partial [Flavobacteriaceae bacterium]|nr:amidohydrolase [Flavobacteriaceae bacterium]